MHNLEDIISINILQETIFNQYPCSNPFIVHQNIKKDKAALMTVIICLEYPEKTKDLLQLTHLMN